MKTIGYKQCTEYFNREPMAYHRIDGISDINTSYYNPAAKKAETKEELLARKKRYCFNLTIPTSNVTAKRHVYYFDSEKKAKTYHRKLKIQLYDQLTKPFLKKINRGRKLSLREEEILTNIINSF